MAYIKRTVQSVFFDAGITLEKDALSAFVSFVEENNGGEEVIHALLDASTKGKPAPCATGAKHALCRAGCFAQRDLTG